MDQDDLDAIAKLRLQNYQDAMSGKMLGNAFIGDHAPPQGQDQIQESMDPMDVIPPDEAAALAAGMLKGKGLGLALGAGITRKIPNPSDSGYSFMKLVEPGETSAAKIAKNAQKEIVASDAADSARLLFQYKTRTPVQVSDAVDGVLKDGQGLSTNALGHLDKRVDEISSIIGHPDLPDDTHTKLLKELEDIHQAIETSHGMDTAKNIKLQSVPDQFKLGDSRFSVKKMDDGKHWVYDNLHNETNVGFKSPKDAKSLASEWNQDELLKMKSMGFNPSSTQKSTPLNASQSPILSSVAGGKKEVPTILWGKGYDPEIDEFLKKNPEYIGKFNESLTKKRLKSLEDDEE